MTAGRSEARQTDRVTEQHTVGTPEPDDTTPEPGDTTDSSTKPNTLTGHKDDPSDQDSTADQAKATTKDDAASVDSPADQDEPASKDSATDQNETGDEKETGDRKEPGEQEGPDRWAAFGPPPEFVPGRIRSALRRVGRFLIHEWTLAVVGAAVLAVLMTWPTLRYPFYTLPHDYLDPSLQAWQMAWSGHILLTDPAQLWQSNTFFPERWTFAFSDTLLGYAPAGLLGHGPQAAILRYNIVYVFAHFLATIGAYALARQLGAGRIGAAVAGVSFTYAPWLLAQSGHLHVISNGGIPLALAMLARGHGYSFRRGYRPNRRHAGWALAGWLVAAWQLSLGFGIGLPFAYVLGLLVIASVITWYVRRTWFWAVKRPFGVRLLLADAVGGLLFAATGVLLALPYFKVAEQYPYARRTVGDLGSYSPPWNGFLVAPAESRVWGHLHETARAALPWAPEMTLLAGFVLYALAIGGLFFSVWKLRHRLLLLAGVLVTGVLSMGTRFFHGRFTYVPLFEHVPGWDGLRTPGRLMLWTTLLLGLLAAGALTAFAMRVRELAAQRVPAWPGPWLRMATLLPLVLVLVEGLSVMPQPVVPRQPVALRTVTGPVLVLPSNQDFDQPVMLWSTDRFPDVVNGGSGFTPKRLAEVREVTATFPDQRSIDYLRQLGVKTVVLVRSRVAGTPLAATIDIPSEPFGVRREEAGDAVVYHLTE